jgi:hypothetical protein
VHAKGALSEVAALCEVVEDRVNAVVVTRDRAAPGHVPFDLFAGKLANRLSVAACVEPAERSVQTGQ